MSIFAPQVLAARRQRVAEALPADGPALLITAGEPIGKPGGLDQTYPFQPYPEYYWLTGSRRWGGALVFDPRRKGEAAAWRHFVRPVSAAERLWEGGQSDAQGEDVEELGAWLAARAGDGAVAVLGAAHEVAPAGRASAEATAAVQEAIDRVRRRKDDAEIDLVRRAAAATAAGHARAREAIRPGNTERQVQIELEAEMYRHGADEPGYGTIVGAGANAAVLHFEPGDRVIGDRDLVLVDAGGAIAGYTADVTRTYAAGGRFTDRQQAIYDVVRSALAAASARCRTGVEWHDVHRVAAATMAEGLRDLRLLSGEVDDLLESEAIALFFPHGIGHMVGLGVRDVGGRVPGRDENRRCCGVRVRVDLPLEPGLLMTVEPGLYFVPALLDDVELRERHREQVRWDEVDRWREVGGVRLEDNVVITDGEPLVLTSDIPL